jgi:hypothetical protein
MLETGEPSVRTLFILLFGVLIMHYGCKQAPEETQSREETQTPAQAVSPQLTTVQGSYTITVSPSSPRKNQPVRVKVDGAPQKKLRYQWTMNGQKIKGAHAPVFIGDVNKNDRIQVLVTVVGEDREYRSEEIMVGNTPPRVLSAQFIPQYPKKGDELTLTVKTIDEDNDSVTHVYKWSVNGRETGGETKSIQIDGDRIKRGDTITVKITPTDRESRGKPLSLSTQVMNSLPTVSPDITADFNGQLYTANVLAEDPDGDPLTFALRKKPEGMTIDRDSGIITWKVSQKDQGEHPVIVSVSDSHGGESIAIFNTEIQLMTPP